MHSKDFHERLYELERGAILPVKWGLLGLCYSLAVLTEPGYSPFLPSRPEILLLLLAFTFSNGVLTYVALRVPEIVRHIQAYSIVSYSADVALVCGLTYLTGGLASEYFILFFLVVFRGSGIFPTVRSTLIGDAAAALVYSLTLILSHQSISVVTDRVFLIRFCLTWGVVLLAWLLVHVIARQKDDYVTALRDLQVHNEFLNNILRSMREGFVAVDGAGGVTLMNNAAQRILGLEGQSSVGEDIYVISPPLARVIEHTRTSQGQMSDVTVRLREGDGTGVELLVSACVIESMGDDGDVGVACVFRDMSDVRRLEAGLIRSEKLASVGELAAGLAHELGNPLAIVKSCTDYLRQSLGKDNGQEEEIDIIHAEVERCRAIVAQLLSLARPADQERAVIDLVPLLSTAAELAHLGEGAEGVRIVDEIDRSPMMVVANAGELTSVFTNIISNAIAAVEGEGVVTVRARADAERDDAGIVEIVDTGKGIDEEELPHIFTPFFTRREGGTGLGLSIVARILDQLGATCEVESTVGQGTTFRLSFPLARRRRRAEGAPA